MLCGLVFSISLALAVAAGTQHSGEILGTHLGERTITLRVIRPEGKEVLVFHVPEDAVIRDARSKRNLRFEDLKAGMRATVASSRSDGKRRATEITVRELK